MLNVQIMSAPLRSTVLIPLPGSARAQYQVGPASQDGLQHPGHCSRIIAAITVEEDHNIGLVCGQCTGQAGRTLGPLRLLHDGSPSGFSTLPL